RSRRSRVALPPAIPQWWTGPNRPRAGNPHQWRSWGSCRSRSVFWPAVDDALGLALRALDGAGLDDAHRRGHADEALDQVLGAAGRRLLDAGREAARELGAGLDQHVERVERALAAHLEQIVRRELMLLDQHRLDLRREHVDAADDQHVVAASLDAL